VDQFPGLDQCAEAGKLSEESGSDEGQGKMKTRDVKGRLLRAVTLLATLMSTLVAPAFAEQPIELDDSAVSIVVFSAFACPYSKEAQKVLDALKAKYGERVRIITKHFPLQQSVEGLLPHEAALSAESQGKAEPMQRALFDSQASGLGRQEIDVIAARVGVDQARLAADLQKGQWRERIVNDMREARAFKVTASPTFFIEGFKLEGLQRADIFEQLIDHSIAKANQANGAVTLQRLSTLLKDGNARAEAVLQKIKPAQSAQPAQ
jgi:predicted DsbA family dithiol-disulfide isomerase